MIVACGLPDSDCLDSGFSDLGSAQPQAAGLRFAPLDLSMVDLKTAAIRPLAGWPPQVPELKAKVEKLEEIKHQFEVALDTAKFAKSVGIGAFLVMLASAASRTFPTA